MKALLCYHNRQGRFTPVWQGCVLPQQHFNRKRPHVRDQNIGRMPYQFFLADEAGSHSDRAHAVRFSRANVVGMIADERHWTRAVDPAFAARVPQCDADQSRAIASHFRERAEAQVAAQSGALHLGPADAREVAGDQARRDAAPPEFVKQQPRRGTNFAAQIGTRPHVGPLRVVDDLRHLAADERGGGAFACEHGGQNIAVEHPGDGDAVGGGYDPGDFLNRGGKRFAMMWPRSTEQRAIDIEKD